MKPLELLDDAQMQSFLRQGYITLETNLPVATHEQILGDIRHVFSTDGNPGNDILLRVDALHDVLNAPTVAGALSSLLGPDYLLHPHRHCHLNPAGSEGQRMHQDSYEADQNVRHHRVRWLMAFYYPQDVVEGMGPSSIVPATQHLTAQTQGCEQELSLHGRAGTVTIVHYDLWHRATPNVTERDRYMVKFLFTRLTEPTAPTWQHEGSGWAEAAGGDSGDADTICRQNWSWMCGTAEDCDRSESRSRSPRPGSQGSSSKCVDSTDHVSAEALDELRRQLTAADESQRLAAAYQLGEAGAVPLLVEALRAEGADRVGHNLERSHTNPVQFDTSFGLTKAGSAAVPALTSLLADETWWLRASAADILGDMGGEAVEAVPALAAVLTDSSEWVRRNAAEALGVIGSTGTQATDTHSVDAVADAVAKCLKDESVAVRHNAALALARMGRGPSAALETATQDESVYVRELSKVALASA